MKKNNFAVFILSNGRARTIKTHKTFEEHGYTGQWFVVVDDLDKDLPLYKDYLGEENIIVFDKKKAAEKVDSMTNNGKLNSVVFARNICYELAREKGFTNFVMADDDITTILFRYKEGEKLANQRIKNLDRFFELLFEFGEKTNSSALSVGMEGDFIGGLQGSYQRGFLRRTFGLFCLNTNRQFEFKGLANEDLNSCLVEGRKGKLFLSTLIAQIHTGGEGKEGGMTDFYQEKKSKYEQHFYTIMAIPSATKIRAAINGLKLNTSWDNAIPCIVEGRWKK